MIRPLRDLEKEAILEAILETGSVQEAASELGMSRSAIYYKIRSYGIALKANQIITELRRQKKIHFSDY